MGSARRAAMPLPSRENAVADKLLKPHAKQDAVMPRQTAAISALPVASGTWICSKKLSLPKAIGKTMNNGQKKLIKKP